MLDQNSETYKTSELSGVMMMLVAITVEGWGEGGEDCRVNDL